MATDSKTPTTYTSQLKTADQLASKRSELSTLRTQEVREWALNRAFYKGNQWVFWNRMSSQVEALPTLEGEKPRWMVRLTANQIRPGVQHYVAQLTKNKPTIQATPNSAAYRDRLSADMATSLFEYWWSELELKSKLQSGLTHAAISQGWWNIGWDALAGKSMQIIIGPDGKPITDEELADVYLDELTEVAEQQGLDPAKIVDQFKKTVYVGDIFVEAIPGENVWIDPAPMDYTKAAYAICRHVMDVEEIKGRWGVDVVPSASLDNSVPLAYSRKRDGQPKTVREVYKGYFRPTPSNPKGRMVVWIEEPNTILEDKPWPYPFNELPLVKFPGIERPDSAMDEPIVSDARPLQKELNRTLSQIVQHKDLTIKPQMIAPVGSMRTRLTDEPGAVFEYQPINGMMPEWRPTPQLPASAFNILADIQQRIDRLFNRIPSQRDSLPARIDAGYSIELLQESVADQLSTIIGRLEEALSRAGWLMVLLAQEYYTEPRMYKIKGAGGSVRVKKFINADLKGGFSFSPQSGSGLPRSRAGRQARILELVNANMLDRKSALKLLDLSDLGLLEAQAVADEDQAYREHEKLIEGEPISVTAMTQAQMQVQQMMSDPTADSDGDGQPDSPQQKMMMAQQIMQKAAVAPTEFEDWEGHLGIHGFFMKSPEFEKFPPEVQGRFVDHYMATFQRVMAMKQAALTLDPRVAPNVNLNFKATTSPEAASEMLERVGVHSTPEELAQMPLDTVVFDSVDAPNVGESGNSHIDEMAQLMEMQQAEETHQLKTAQTAHQMALAENNHQMTMQQQQQRAKQDSVMHAAKVKAANRPKTSGQK